MNYEKDILDEAIVKYGKNLPDNYFPKGHKGYSDDNNGKRVYYNDKEYDKFESRNNEKLNDMDKKYGEQKGKAENAFNNILAPKIEKLLKTKYDLKNIKVKVTLPNKSGFNDPKTNLPDGIRIVIDGDKKKEVVLKKLKGTTYYPAGTRHDIYDVSITNLINKIMKGGHGLFSKNYSVVNEDVNYFPY